MWNFWKSLAYIYPTVLLTKFRKIGGRELKTRHSHFFCPQILLKLLFFNFTWEHAYSREKLKATVYAKFGAKISVLWECGEGGLAWLPRSHVFQPGYRQSGWKTFPIWTLQPGYRNGSFLNYECFPRSLIKLNAATDNVLKHSGHGAIFSERYGKPVVRMFAWIEIKKPPRRQSRFHCLWVEQFTFRAFSSR